ncbi:MAG TPA: AIR synthase-related protein, partial [Candidatus Acidoferrum sp.]
NLGASIELKEKFGPAESALFGERGARAIISVSPSSLDAVQKIAQQHGVSAQSIGRVTGDAIFSIQYQGSAIIKESVGALRDIWSHALERALTR